SGWRYPSTEGVLDFYKSSTGGDPTVLRCMATSGERYYVDTKQVVAAVKRMRQFYGSKADVSWLLAEHVAAQAVSQETLVEVIKGVRRLVAAEAFDSLRTMLDYLAGSATTNTESILAALRAARGARRKIASWKTIVGRARDNFVHRNLDADQLLQGL